MENHVAVIDLKAFYAFVECVERGLDPFKTPLVVVDTTRGEGTIVLSVSPFLKAKGVPSRCRKYELPKNIDYIFAPPQMELYIKKSCEVVSIFLDFVGQDDIHIYSIDESFLNLGPYLKLYKCSAIELVEKIQNKILKELKLVTAAGIAANPFVAKTALDIEAKKKEPYRVYWTKKDIEEKFWPFRPVSKMWGISFGLERRLNELGIISIGDLANYDRAILLRHLGVIGGELYDHANGVDESDIREKYVPEETSLTVGQTLFKDYYEDSIKTIILEMCDDACHRLRLSKQKTKQVHLMIGYEKSRGGGFYKSILLDFPTDDNDVIYDALLKILHKHIQAFPIRSVSVCFSKLVSPLVEQLSLFVDVEDIDKKNRYFKIIDAIQHRFGANACLRLSSLLEESTVKIRHSQIGGHKK